MRGFVEKKKKSIVHIIIDRYKPERNEEMDSDLIIPTGFSNVSESELVQIESRRNDIKKQKHLNIDVIIKKSKK